MIPPQTEVNTLHTILVTAGEVLVQIEKAAASSIRRVRRTWDADWHLLNTTSGLGHSRANFVRQAAGAA